MVTSITTGRPGKFDTPLGGFEFRHVKLPFFRGYCSLEFPDRQKALVGTPEKALLDLLYLQPGSDSVEYLKELRLQNLEILDLRGLRQLARGLKSKKLLRAVEIITALADAEVRDFSTL